MIRNRILSAAVSSSLTRVVMYATRFFLTPFILHRLGDTQYGLFILVGSLVGQGALLDFGIKSAMTKYVSEHYASGDYPRARALIVTSIWLYLALGLILLLLAVAIAPFFPRLFNVPSVEQATATHVMLLMGVQVAISLPASILSSVLWGLNRYGLVNALLAIETLFHAVAMVAVLLTVGGVTALVAVTIPVTLVMQAVTIWCVRRTVPELRLGLRGGRRDLIRSVFSYGVSMFVIDLSGNLQSRIDQIVIGAVMPVSSVSPYSVARRLSILPQAIGQMCVGAFVPLSSQLHARDDVEKLRALYIVGTRMTLAVAVSIATALIALAAPLLTLWVGAQYSGYASIMITLTLASLADISHWPGSAILQGMSRHHGLAVVAFIAALANLGLSILLVRPFGLMGVAIGTLIPTTLLSVCYVWPYTARIIGVPLRDLLKQAIVPAFGPALPMAAVMYGATRIISPYGLLPTAAIMAAGLATYVLVYFIFCAGAPELELLQSVRNRLVRI